LKPCAYSFASSRANTVEIKSNKFEQKESFDER